MSQQGEPKPGKAEAGLGDLSLGSRCGEGDPLQRAAESGSLVAVEKVQKYLLSAKKPRLSGWPSGVRWAAQQIRTRKALSEDGCFCPVHNFNSLGSVEAGQEYGHN